MKPYLNTTEKLNETLNYRKYTHKFDYRGNIHEYEQAANDIIMITVVSAVVGLAIIGKKYYYALCPFMLSHLLFQS